MEKLPWVPESVFFFRSEAATVSGEAAIVIHAREKKEKSGFFFSLSRGSRSRLRRSQSQLRYEKKNPLAPRVSRSLTSCSYKHDDPDFVFLTHMLAIPMDTIARLLPPDL